MIRRTLGQIAGMIRHSSLDAGHEVLQVTGVSTDTRSIGPGSLFIPLIGPRFNGHDYVREAIERGAAASLWNRGEADPPEDVPLLYVEDTLAALQELAAVYRRQLRVKVVGITGSNGKTSTKDMLASLLGTTYITWKTQGNLNNHIGVPLTLLQLEEDTEMAVVEMGMSALGEIESLSRLAQPDVAIITSVSEVHLGDLRSRDKIAQAKAEILQGLKPGGLFVYNADNPRLTGLLEEHALSGFRSTSFGEASHHPWHLTSCSETIDGTSFTLSDPWCPRLHLTMLGRHQAVNALGAIAVARYFGIPYDRIQAGLRQVEATGMRQERITIGRLTVLNDAYKSNPTSLRAALQTLYALGQGRRTAAVLGEMAELGEEAAELHREIGRELDAGRIELLLTLGPMAALIAQEAESRFPPGSVVHCRHPEEAVARLASLTEADVLVLVKGSRSLRMERIVEALQQEVRLC